MNLGSIMMSLGNKRCQCSLSQLEGGEGRWGENRKNKVINLLTEKYFD